MGKGGKKAQIKPRGERKDDLERKRDERARRSALRKERQAKTYYSLEDDEDYASFCNQLQVVGLKIKEIPGDGNCLFRAIADQLFGDHNQHAQLRQSTVQYMRENSFDFEPFHDGNTTFNEYLELLGKDGTYAGNDAIVAFARSNNVDIVIHQHSSPRFVINAPVNPRNIQLHLAYHNGEHYSSLRRIHDTSDGPAYLNHNTQFFLSQKNCKPQPKVTSMKTPSSSAEEKLSDYLSTDCCLSETERNVMESTSCKDPELVKQALEESGQDVDSAVAYILQLLSLDEASAVACVEPEQKSLLNAEEPTAKNPNTERSQRVQKQAHLSNRQRKELAKQAKKKRRLEEQKNQAKPAADNSLLSQEHEKDVGTVSI